MVSGRISVQGGAFALGENCRKKPNYKKMAGDKMRCPVCQSREVGIIGEDRYFCWNCQVEFNNAAEVFTISLEGNLTKTAVK